MEVDTLQNILTLNVICVWLIELAKRSKYLPWITAETKQVNKAASAVLAALSSAGITVLAVNQGAGSYSIQITGLTTAAILHFVWHVMGNYAVQKWIYKVVVPRGSSARRMAAGVGKPAKHILEPEAA
jgi:hypothetical protein